MGFKVPKRGKKSKKWDFLIFKGLAIFKGLENLDVGCSGGLGMQHTISYPYALSSRDAVQARTKKIFFPVDVPSAPEATRTGTWGDLEEKV